MHFAENTIKIGVSAPPPKKEKKHKKKPSVKHWSKLAFKIGPSMLRNKIGPVLTLELGHCLFLFLFLKILFFLQGERDFQKHKKKLGPVSNTKKGKHWTSFLTLQHVYIYIRKARLLQN